MLGIKYSDIFFDLYPDTTITLEINNPLFDNNILSGSYSFPFKIPLTPLNRRFLNMPADPGSTVRFDVPLIVDLYIDNILLFPQGELRIKNVPGTYAECFLLTGISSFAQFANSVKVAEVLDFIQEVEFSDQPADDNKNIAVIAERSVSADVSTTPFVFFPVLNDNNYPQDKVDYDQGNYYEIGQGQALYNTWVYENEMPHHFFSVIHTENWRAFMPATMCPFFYITWIVRQLLKNFKVDSNIFEKDSELKTLVLLNNFCLDNYKLVLKDIGNNQTVSFKTNTSGRNIEAKNHVPDMLTGDFLIALKNFFCLYLFKNPFTATISFDSMNSVFDDPAAVNWDHIIYPLEELAQEAFNGLSFKPEDSGDNYIKNTPTTENQIVIGMGLSAFPPATANLGELYYFTDLAAFYKWNGTAWEVYGSGYSDYYINPKKFEVTPAFSACLNNDVFFKVEGGDYQQNIPIIDLPGSYYLVERGGQVAAPAMVSNPNCIKLCFYRGMTPEINNPPRSYPLGTSNSFYNGGRVGNYSLSFLGYDGLYEKWWKKYINFLSYTKIIKARAKLDLLQLLNLDLRKKIEVQGQQYFIKKLSLQLPLTKPVQLELWKAGGLENIQPLPKYKSF